MKKVFIAVVVGFAGFVHATEIVLTADADADIRSATSSQRSFDQWASSENGTLSGPTLTLQNGHRSK